MHIFNGDLQKSLIIAAQGENLEKKVMVLVVNWERPNVAGGFCSYGCAARNRPGFHGTLYLVIPEGLP